MTNCLFCKIASGEIPSECVYENEHTFAFLDITPSNHGHTLVIPKKHFDNIYEMDEKHVFAVAKTAQKVAMAIKKAVAADGINIISNNGRAAGQEVFHAHTHIVPRFEGDGVFKKARHTGYKENEIEKVAGKIRTAL